MAAIARCSCPCAELTRLTPMPNGQLTTAILPRHRSFLFLLAVVDALNCLLSARMIPELTSKSARRGQISWINMYIYIMCVSIYMCRYKFLYQSPISLKVSTSSEQSFAQSVMFSHFSSTSRLSFQELQSAKAVRIVVDLLAASYGTLFVMFLLVKPHPTLLPSCFPRML